MEVEANTSGQTQAKTKFCKHCGGTIPQDAVMCTHCGRQGEELAGAAQPQVVIQNTNMNTNTAAAVVAGVEVLSFFSTNSGTCCRKFGHNKLGIIQAVTRVFTAYRV